ncbi:hypothetical protein DLJ46_00655 [Micromonospora globispora]|uniref:Uncharacterized protein n=1 Tax=Micromonospora globispora TaxID=1450148 RepID=A0A317KK46_9ACTN|nr:hypothetical protein [Micromonospora globispora]PWU53783.1 hypothetical protein DLJ46_00655 [Micromonospora globispora]
MTKEELPGGAIVFGIGRRKTQGQLAKAELNQGIGHLRQAATYAAKGAGATVGPRVQAARGAVAPTAVMVRDRASSGVASTAAALAPLLLAVRNAQAGAAGKAVADRKVAAAKQVAMSKKVKAKNMKAAKKKQKKSRGGMMTGLLAAGTVAGLAGAMAMRRRREQQEWAEYDPTAKLDPMREDVDTIVVETPDPSAKVTEMPTTSGGPTGAGSSAVAGGSSASTTTPGTGPVIAQTDKVPSVAEGARDVSGRPADDVTKALSNGKNAAKASGHR